MSPYDSFKTHENLIRLELIDGFLVDLCGIRFRRKKPVISFAYERSERDTAVIPAELATHIIQLEEHGELDIREANSYCVIFREPINKTRKVQRRRGPETEHLVERCIIELYHIGA